MYRLTEKRLFKAETILEEYRDKLYRYCRFDAGQLDLALRKCWNIGYQELKSIMKDMLRHARYRYLALYYMQNISQLVVIEFKGPLANAYGSTRYDDPNTQQKRQSFWAKFNDKVKSGAAT
jgi:hypothetical protein